MNLRREFRFVMSNLGPKQKITPKSSKTNPMDPKCEITLFVSSRGVKSIPW